MATKDTVAWFACFAPFDHPKYVVVVMVQGGEHGGGVAGPIADANHGTHRLHWKKANSTCRWPGSRPRTSRIRSK